MTESNVNKIKNSFLKDAENVKDLKSLEQVRVKYLGRKGELTAILRSLKNLPIQERRRVAPKAQQLKKELEETITKKQKELSTFNFQHSVLSIDVTKPGHKIKIGHIHPLSKIEEEIRHVFLSMNFSVVEGPEIENEYYNFDALNIPKDHPARDGWNTFWLKAQTDAEQTQRAAEKIPRNSASSPRKSALLLRTHTSPMQIHYMKNHQPPFQIIVPGRVFRYEATDASHETTFSQMEGLMVGKDVSLANFKFIIEHFLKKLFGSEIEFELRPSYYPFTEPSVDVYMKWRGKWLEVAGAGMVHPKVFEAVGYNPYEWQGFAFGFGLNRLAMIKYKIPDIRLFYNGDLRFIRQF